MFEGMSAYNRDPNTVVRTKTWGDPVKWDQGGREASRSRPCLHLFMDLISSSRSGPLAG